MVLDLDCVRAIMLYIEKNQVYETLDVSGMDQMRRLKIITSAEMQAPGALPGDFSPDMIEYCCNQADESGLIEAKSYVRGPLMITDITPKGHEFVAALKSETVWTQVKSRAKTLGGITLPIAIKMGADILMKLAGL